MRSRAWSCEGKQQFSRVRAKRVARKMRRRGERAGEYHCDFCKWWHVGHSGD
jgi:hypothetical protein